MSNPLTEEQQQVKDFDQKIREREERIRQRKKEIDGLEEEIGRKESELLGDKTELCVATNDYLEWLADRDDYEQIAEYLEWIEKVGCAAVYVNVPDKRPLTVALARGNSFILASILDMTGWGVDEDMISEAKTRGEDTLASYLEHRKDYEELKTQNGIELGKWSKAARELRLRLVKRSQ